MVFSLDQIERIQSRLPGWEEDWRRLCVLLLGEDGESGALYRAVKALGVRWPSEVERDDFVAERMLDYHNRAVQGTLLLSYDLQRAGDVVSFLTTHRVIYPEAIKFLEKVAVRQLASIDRQCSEGIEPEAKPRHDATFAELISAVQEELQRVRLEGTKRITRVHEQAALQLHPRLDWSQPAMNPLREHLVRAVRPPSDGIDSMTALGGAHRDADQSYQEQLESLLLRMERVAARLERLRTKLHKVRDQHDIEMEKFIKGCKLHQHLYRQYGDLCFQRVFLPLNADTLVRLLGIKPADAAQRRHRYRAELPRLLPALGTYYEALREHRSAASKGGSDET